MNKKSKTQRGETRRNPQEGMPVIANTKGDPSWRQTELIPRCQRDNSNKDWSWRQKELIPRRQQKLRGIPEKESLGIFISKGDPNWSQKDINSKVPEGQFLHSVQFLRISKLAPKGNNSEVPAGDFRTNGKIST